MQQLACNCVVYCEMCTVVCENGFCELGNLFDKVQINMFVLVQRFTVSYCLVIGVKGRLSLIWSFTVIIVHVRCN